MSTEDTEDVELSNGQTVTVRGLSGMEVALISKRNAATLDDTESAAGMAMQVGFALLNAATAKDAEKAGNAWLRSSVGGDFTKVADAIERMSAYGKGAQKSAVDRATDDQ